MKWEGQKKRPILAVLLLIFCMGIALGHRAATAEDITGMSDSEDTTSASASEEYLPGKGLDIQLSRLKVKGRRAGAQVTLSFTVSGAENTTENYKVDRIEKVWLGNEADSFPFASEDETYKVISGRGKRLSCSWKLRAKEDLSTGYYKVRFYILYRRRASVGNLGKYDSLYLIEKSVDIRIQGKTENKTEEKTEEKKVSVPRLMVTGRTFDREKIYPGDQFQITLQVRNTSDDVVRNIKYTISSGKGEFFSADGTSSTFLPSVSAHGTSEITFFLEASLDLTAKPYQLCVFAEYEDKRVNRYEATDYVTIPITVQDRISITDVRKPEKLTAGTDGDLTMSVNNVGESTIRNVTVRLEGEDFRAQKAFVGNLAGGSSGYADIYVQGIQRTLEGSGKNAKIIVSYVGSSGQEKSYEKKVRIAVKEEVPEDLKALSQETDTEDTGRLPKQVIALLIAALCIVGCGVFLKYRKGGS